MSQSRITFIQKIDRVQIQGDGITEISYKDLLEGNINMSFSCFDQVIFIY